MSEVRVNGTRPYYEEHGEGAAIERATVPDHAADTAALLDAEARAGIGAVGEALIGEVLGDDVWRSFPDELRELFTGNGPAIMA